jgi:hypothetical protein
MRSLVLSLVLAASSLGLVAATPSKAQAQVPYYPGYYYYTPYYYPYYYYPYYYPYYSSYYYWW